MAREEEEKNALRIFNVHTENGFHQFGTFNRQACCEQCIVAPTKYKPNEFQMKKKIANTFRFLFFSCQFASAIASVGAGAGAGARAAILSWN